MMPASVFFLLRLVHIVIGVAWAGAVIFIAAFLLRVRNVQLGLRRLEICLGLIVLVLHVTSIDLDKQIARLHESACFDRHLGDESRCFGLHLDDIDRLDGARSLGVDDDRAARHKRRLHERRVVLVTTTRGGADSDERQRENSLHETDLQVGKGILDYTDNLGNVLRREVLGASDYHLIAGPVR